jgi:hypothetical protein
MERDHVLVTELQVVAHCDCQRRLVLAEVDKKNFREDVGSVCCVEE